MQIFDVVIIGGGAAGLACAVALKREDSSLSVVIVERGERLGRKLAATGNGQGNVSNTDLDARHFHGSLAPLAAELVKEEKYGVDKLFDCILLADRNGRIYPAGKQASALSDSLIKEAQRLGVQIILSAEVTALSKGFTLTLANGNTLGAKNVVLAFGGKAQKQFGTDGKGFCLANSMGHSVTQLTPSIVQLKCDTEHIKTLKGIRAECRVRAFDSENNQLCSTCGDVIFTDYGVSGNAVFYASSYVAGKQGAYLSLEFLPSVPIGDIERNIEKKISLNYPISELLSGTLHNQIGREVIKHCKAASACEIAKAVKNFTLNVVGSLGFDYAQVTKGGVPASEVGQDLQSKFVEGLYIIGEALDVDGDCGGYNLTWAFASGMHAAKNIVDKLNCYD